MTNQNDDDIPTHDNKGNQLTLEEQALYARAIDITEQILAQLKGEPCALLQAIAFMLFEKYMQLANPADLGGVAEVVDKLAGDMKTLATAMANIPKPPRAAG